MLEQAWTALAAAGGAAVVRAAGTDAWTGLGEAVARWFARGDAQRERAERTRLDQTAGALRSADDAERVRIREEAAWQARIEALLEGLDHIERVRAVEELRAVLAEHDRPGTATADGSIAVGAGHGGGRVGRPSVPVPSRG
ncbi:hypothetical protein ACH47Z_00430 [Streptomyces sp. NPDC020192]|uniref:hypothetical protein n=1 Tax=Streptomyces sp. NPDC020192 TaxID=3365066 RepID=UPI0037907E94